MKANSRGLVLGSALGIAAGSYGLCGTTVTIPPPPTPTPTVEASPSPEPTVFPTPSPAETPTPWPTPTLCVLPPSQAPQSGCTDRPASLQFEEDVREAQRLAASNGFVVDGIVIDEVAYTREVARILRVMGLCAESGADVDGPIDEVWAKDTNGFSAHWDLVRGGTNEVLTLNAARCIPAKF